MSNYSGDFLWYELMTQDPKAAQSFYKKVIGWKTESWTDGPMPYTMWKAGDVTIGGIQELPEAAQKSGAPAHWLGYVGTSDLDQSFAKMQSLGGKAFVPPMDIPTVGRIAVFADPHGAMIAMYQPAGDPPPSHPQGPGQVSWRELMSGDLDGAVAFYESLFGWNKTQAMDMGPAGLYQMYGKGETTFGGMMKRPEGMPTSAWLYYITVADIKKTLPKVTKNGGKVLNGPMEVPGGDLVAQCVDPQGAAFALHQMAAKK